MIVVLLEVIQAQLGMVLIAEIILEILFMLCLVSWGSFEFFWQRLWLLIVQLSRVCSSDLVWFSMWMICVFVLI